MREKGKNRGKKGDKDGAGKEQEKREKGWRKSDKTDIRIAH